MSRSRPYRREFVPAAIVLFAFSLVVIRYPLFDYLGYEFSAATALLVPLTSGYLTLRLLRRRMSGVSPYGVREFRRDLFVCLSWNFWLLALPLAVATGNLFFVKNCSWGEGLLFFLLLPGVTTLFSVALAAFCAVIVRRPGRMYSLALAAVLLQSLYIGYATPQIYSYDLIYGFFPGFSYDEVLVIAPALVYFRIATVILASLLALLAGTITGNASPGSGFPEKLRALKALFTLRVRSVLALSLAVLLILAWAYRIPLGFESSAGAIRTALGGVYATPHFHIYYSKRSFSDGEIRLVGAEHEFRFHQVEKALGPGFAGTIDSYLYPDAETKHRWIGTGTTNIAKPWRNEIHLNADSWEGTLKHELVHVMAGAFGMPLVKAHYHLGLVEGLATAVDGDWGNRTLDEYAAAMGKFGLVRDPAALISPLGFMTHFSSVSYVMMGSFCGFLIDRYGIVRFRELYAGHSPRSVYGRSYDSLAGEWQHALRSEDIPEAWRKHIEFFFKRPSIFARECARAVAKLNEAGMKLLGAHDSSARGLFLRSLGKSWNTEGFSGLVRTEYAAGRFDSVRALISRELADPLHRPGILNLLLLYGDALWEGGDVPLAQTVYADLLALDLSERYDEVLSLRLAVTSEAAYGDSLKAYFLGRMKDSSALALMARVERPGPLVSYVKGVILLRQKEYRGAIAVLANEKRALSSAVLEAAKERMTAEAFFRVREYEHAREHFWQSLNFTSNRSSRERIDDWLERCSWYEENERLLE